MHEAITACTTRKDGTTLGPHTDPDPILDRFLGVVPTICPAMAIAKAGPVGNPRWFNLRTWFQTPWPPHVFH